MPAEYADQCGDPGVSVGQDARQALGRTRQALAECERKREGAVLFYDSVKRNFDTPNK